MGFPTWTLVLNHLDPHLTWALLHWAMLYVFLFSNALATHNPAQITCCKLWPLCLWLRPAATASNLLTGTPRNTPTCHEAYRSTQRLCGLAMFNINKIEATKTCTWQTSWKISSLSGSFYHTRTHYKSCQDLLTLMNLKSTKSLQFWIFLV